MSNYSNNFHRNIPVNVLSNIIKRSVIVPLLILLFVGVDASDILCLFPTPSYSHQMPMLTLSKALAAKGHNMTVITANPSKVPVKNHREIDISYAYKEWAYAQSQNKISLQKTIDSLTLIQKTPEFLDFFTHLLYNAPEVQKFIREVNGTKYDLIIYENLGCLSVFGFTELTGNPPVVGIVTLNPFVVNDISMGNPTLLGYVPYTLASLDDRMTFLERIYNLIYNMYFLYVYKYKVIPKQEEYLRKNFGENLPRTVKDYEKAHSLLIVSADLSTSYPRPLQPNTIFVGSMHVGKKSLTLPQDIKKWMDDSEDGVIYFSLGSNMKGKSVPEEIRQAFIKVFSQFSKIRVLWKWETDEKLPGQPDNVMTKKWLPQEPILAHPKCRLFISQVGLQSFQESIYYGVPMLGVPVFADQEYNAKKIVNSGVGLSVEFHSITYELLYDQLKSILSNTSYKENMSRLSMISKDKPMSAVDTAVWWIEYVIRHKGAPHLRPSSLDMSWYEYFMLDVLLLVISVPLFIVYTLYWTVRKFVVTRNQSSYDKLKKN